MQELYTPIYTAIKKYSEENSSRFHTPAHSGVDIDGWLYQNADLDITELSFSDNLQCPDSIINESQKLMAKLYGVKEVLYLTSGGTGAIFIAINVIRNLGKTLIVIGNCHKTVFSACRMAGLNIIFAEIDNIKHYLDRDDIAGVFVTTPDYYGATTDLNQLVKNLRKKGVKLIIDHSHGMHYVFSNNLPISQVSLGDMVICSLHKTLPVMTGGAMLAINNEELVKYALYYRMNLHSTSPNYTTLASIDYARAYMQANGERLYLLLLKRIKMINDELSDTPYRVFNNNDWTRLVINTGDYCGYSVSEELEKLNIYPEMADNDMVVFIVTPFNGDKLTELIKALHSLKPKKKIAYEYNLPKPHFVPLKGDIEFVQVEESIGRVAAGEISLYPPGVPILLSGTIIDQNTLNIMHERRKCIIGLVKGMVPVLK